MKSYLIVMMLPYLFVSLIKSKYKHHSKISLDECAGETLVKALTEEFLSRSDLDFLTFQDHSPSKWDKFPYVFTSCIMFRD